MPKDIVDEVKDVLSGIQLKYSEQYPYVTAYQIFNGLSKQRRKQLLDERGDGRGKGSGICYSADGVVAKAAMLARDTGSAEVAYLNTSKIKLICAETDNEIAPGNAIVGLYRLKK